MWGQVQQEERDQIIAAKIKQLAFTLLVVQKGGLCLPVQITHHACVLIMRKTSVIIIYTRERRIRQNSTKNYKEKKRRPLKLMKNPN